MWNWKPIPEDADAKERSLRVACISVSIIMIVWVCFIGGNAIAETASSERPMPAQRDDTDILECRYDDQMEKESKKKKQSESKSGKKHLQTSDSSGKTVKHSDEEPAPYESDESYEEYEEPVYYDDSYEGYEEPVYYDESYDEYEEPVYYDESYEEPSYYEEGYEEPVYYEEGYEEDEVEEDYDEVVQDGYDESQVDSEPSESDSEEDVYYTSDELRNKGEVYDDGQRYTWYSQNVLPGEGLDIPGRHVEEGYVVDEEGNVVLAGSEDRLGEEVDIPFGSGNGKVYDVCGVEGTLDVYTDF